MFLSRYFLVVCVLSIIVPAFSLYAAGQSVNTHQAVVMPGGDPMLENGPIMGVKRRFAVVAVMAASLAVAAYGISQYQKLSSGHVSLRPEAVVAAFSDVLVLASRVAQNVARDVRAGEHVKGNELVVRNSGVTAVQPSRLPAPKSSGTASPAHMLPKEVVEIIQRGRERMQPAIDWIHSSIETAQTFLGTHQVAMHYTALASMVAVFVLQQWRLSNLQERFVSLESQQHDTQRRVLAVAIANQRALEGLEHRMDSSNGEFMQHSSVTQRDISRLSSWTRALGERFSRGFEELHEAFRGQSAVVQTVVQGMHGL